MEGAGVSIVKRNKESLYVWLNLRCSVNNSHTLGVAVLHLNPHPRAGEISLGNGVRWDEFGKVVANCPACAHEGKGSDQRISAARIERRLLELRDAGSDTGDLQA